MPLLAKPQLLDAYRRMRTIREFEERIHVEFATGSIPGFVHLYAGEEASATGICMHLSDADFISSTHRGHGHCIAKGVDPVGMMAEIYGKATGLCKGKGGSMHIADISKGMLGANGIVGAGGPLSCGAALASKIRGNNAVTVCFFGDGASNQGTILESMNLASIWKLPVIFAVENNGYGEGKDDVNIKEWGAILTNYGLTNIDEFDLSISKVIEHGHIHETDLEVEAANLDDKFKANDLENSFSQAWSYFHDSFSDNKDQLIMALKDSFKKSYLQISPMNLNSTVRLMRQLGRDDYANEMIDFYIEKRSNQHKLFDLESYPFAGDMDDTVLLDRFKQAFISGRHLPTLLDTVLDIAKKRGWSEEQIQVIEQATEEDFYQLFMQNQGDNLGRVVKACLQFETIAGRQKLAEKPRSALVRIGQQSVLNALRVRRFGVVVEPAAQHI